MRRIFVLIIIVMAILMQTACSTSKSAEVMDEFYTVAARDIVGVQHVADFIEQNIESVTDEDASEMIMKYEELQKDYLSILEKSFQVDEIQTKFQEEYRAGENDINNPDNIVDETIRNLVIQAREVGYKVEQAEGSFFPAIDYSFYDKYTVYTTSDIDEYIKIMAVESDRPPLKDASLIITWDEVIERALTQEAFLSNFDDSPKWEEVSSLYDKYEYIALYGSDNTPVFDYQTKIINDDAKSAYINAINSDQNSEFFDMIKGFLEALEDNDYKLSDEVDTYREEVV